MSEPLDYAELHWDAEGRPISSVFDDIYFSTANGLEETRYVFLQHNHLRERWQSLADTATTRFVIAETGFGSGLNFLAAWQLWQQVGPKAGWLHVISTEKYPLCRADLSRALALWPELATLAQTLIDQYPAAASPGFHRLNFANANQQGGVSLTLLIGDAAESFGAMQQSQHPVWKAGFPLAVDAWFLDGFAPAKNPAMWSEALFSAVASLSKPTTTVATFTCAGLVKRGLQGAGFTLQKVTGYGRKREMLTGVMTSPPTRPEANEFALSSRGNSPYPVPWDVPPVFSGTPDSVLIIGGGLAGCFSAHHLARRGIPVCLLEKKPLLADAASGNRQGVLYAKLSLDNDALAQYNLHSLQFALQFYADKFTQVGSQCGVLQLSQTDKLNHIHQQLQARYGQNLVRWLSAEAASDIAGLELTKPGLLFPTAGWINPQTLCQSLTQHPLIQTRVNHNAAALNHDGHNWQVTNADGNLIAQAHTVIIANAADAVHLEQTSHLPLKPIRGQVSHLPVQGNSHQLKTVICAEGYVAPADKGIHTMGATFNLNCFDTDLRVADHQANLRNLEKISPEFSANWPSPDTTSLNGRVGFRCTTPDYLPIVGPAPIVNAFDHDYALLRHNAQASIPVAGRCWPNLYLNAGYGSRGLTYGPLASEYLASLICGEPLPVSSSLARSLHPARFIIRQLIRNQR